MSRNEASDLVKTQSGKIGGVSKKLDYLVTNDPNGSSSKLKKARDPKLDIKIISEEEFLQMVDYIDDSEVILNQQESISSESDEEDEIDILLLN